MTILPVPLSLFYTTTDLETLCSVASFPRVSVDMLYTCGARCEFELVQRKQKQEEF